MVELLVAVGIAAILRGLITTLGGNLRGRGQDAKCAGNRRQLGIVLNSYAYENNGLMPAPMGNDLNGTPVSWMIVVQTYLRMTFPKVDSDNIFRCPSAYKTFPNGKVRRSYMMNSAGTDGRTAARPMLYDRPSTVAWLMDAGPNSANEGDGWTTFGITSYEKNIDWRHRDGLNILFLDGHVERLSRSEAARLETYVTNFRR